jgi:oligopeptide transport system ATP-binding protein
VEAAFAEPCHPYTLGLLRSAPTFERVRERLEPIPGVPPDLSEPPAGCRFHPRCGFRQADCDTVDPPLMPVAEGRTSACLHWTSCLAAVRRDPVIADG